jgi:hypothetical protein
MRQQPVHVDRSTTARLITDVDVLATILASLWCDADRLPRNNVDGAHMVLAIDIELAARLAWRANEHLAAALEGEVAA